MTTAIDIKKQLTDTLLKAVVELENARDILSRRAAEARVNDLCDRLDRLSLEPDAVGFGEGWR